MFLSSGLASCSRSIHSISPIIADTTPLLRGRPIRSFRSPFSSGPQPSARQALGRITPKRIAIPIPPGSGFPRDASIPKASIWRPILFCLGFGGGGYVLAAAYTNADTQIWSERLGGGSWWKRGQVMATDHEIARAKQVDAAKQAQQSVNQLPKTLAFLPKVILVPILRIYVTAKEYVLNTPPARVVPMQVAGGMGLVFLAWRVGRWEPFMRKWFLHRPVLFAGGARREWANCVTMFTSVISHQSFAHYFFNSFALTSFGAAAYAFLALPSPGTIPMPSSTHTPHFLAFLLAGGLFSSLASHLWTNLVRLPKLIRTLASPARLSSAQALASHQAILPSLGASGAIYAALTLTACAFPDSNVGIILIPFISFPIWAGVGGMVALDLVGLIRGWQMFDHVAHLGGAAFGFIYYYVGRDAWNWVRRQLGQGDRSSSA